ncbi:MAG: hypothetical protein AB8B61_02995 [Cyclobacteriaceae bacterium]
MLYSNKTKRIILLVAALFPVVFYFFTVFKYTVNIPVADDYFSLMVFLNKYKLADSFSAKFNLFFEPLNMHKIVSSKLIAAIVLWIQGHGDLRIMVIIGNFFLLPCAYFFYYIVKKENNMSMVYVVFFSFLLFNFHYYSFIFLPTVPIQFGSSTAFMLGTIFFLVKENYRNLFIAVVLLIISLMSNSNALVLILIGILHFSVSKKDAKKALIWITGSILAVVLYKFHNNGIKQGDGQILAVFNNPFIYLRWYFTVIGSCFAIRLPVDVLVSQIFGVFFTIIHSYFILRFKHFLKNKPLIFYTFLFFLVSCVMIAVVRGGDVYLAAINYRYRFMSTLLLMCTILLAYSTVVKKYEMHYLLGTGVIVLLVYYTSMTHYKRIKNFTHDIEQNMVRYMKGEDVQLYHVGEQKVGRKIIDESIRLNVYQPKTE